MWSGSVNQDDKFQDIQSDVKTGSGINFSLTLPKTVNMNENIKLGPQTGL